MAIFQSRQKFIKIKSPFWKEPLPDRRDKYLGIPECLGGASYSRSRRIERVVPPSGDGCSTVPGERRESVRDRTRRATQDLSPPRPGEVNAGNEQQRPKDDTDDQRFCVCQCGLP